MEYQIDNKAIMIEGCNAKQSVNIYRWPVATPDAACPIEMTKNAFAAPLGVQRAILFVLFLFLEASD